MAWFSFVYSFFDGPGVAVDPSALWRDTLQRCEQLRKGISIRRRAIPLAERGMPESEDMRPTAIELDIRNVFSREIELGRRRARRRLLLASTGLSSMAIDITEADLKRIKSGLGAKLTEALTALEGRLPSLAHRKVQTESRLAGYHAMNGGFDPPTARSALEWLAATMATGVAEAFVNAHLFKGELGYVDAVGFALGIGGAIALVGVAGGIGWAQLRRPSKGRRLGGAALFAGALGLVLFFVIGLAHYREALVAQSTDAAATAQATMAASPLMPLADTSLLPYLILNLAGFALVCWKSIAMWGFLDLKRYERAAAQAKQHYDNAKEEARGECGDARTQALDLLDETLRTAELNVEQGNQIFARCQGIRDSLKSDSATFANSALACEQEYRELVEMVHPLGSLARFANPPTRIEFEDLLPDETEAAAKIGLTARLMKIKEAMSAIIDEISAAVDAAITRVNELGAEAETDARHNPRGKFANVFPFGK